MLWLAALPQLTRAGLAAIARHCSRLRATPVVLGGGAGEPKHKGLSAFAQDAEGRLVARGQ